CGNAGGGTAARPAFAGRRGGSHGCRGRRHRQCLFRRHRTPYAHVSLHSATRAQRTGLRPVNTAVARLLPLDGTAAHGSFARAADSPEGDLKAISGILEKMFIDKLLRLQVKVTPRTATEMPNDSKT